MRAFLGHRARSSALVPILLLLPAVLLATALSHPAIATTVIALDSFNLLAHSDAVLVGHVETISSYATPEGVVVTDIQVGTDILLKGSGSFFVVRQPGGIVGDLVDRVDEVPSFDIGEQVLLFLEQDTNDPSIYLVMGLYQGKVNLVPEGSRFRLERTEAGVTTIGLPRVEDPSQSWLYLDEFLSNTEVDLP